MSTSLQARWIALLLLCVSVLAIIAASPAQAATGTVSGTVRADGTNAPIEHVTVTIVRYVEANNDFTEFLDFAVTDASGYWEISSASLPTGTYTLHFSPLGLPFDAEFWNNVPFEDHNGGDSLGSFPLTTGGTVTNRDAGLAPFPAITGTVTKAVDGSPMTCGAVQSVDMRRPLHSFVYSDVNPYSGEYAIDTRADVYVPAPGHMESGRYTILARPCPELGAPTYLGDVTDFDAASTVYINPGETASGYDIVAATGGVITGNIQTSSGDGTVTAWSVDNPDSAVAFDRPDDGETEYELAGLPPGNYVLGFAPLAVGACATGDRYEWWSNATTPAAASPIAVANGDYLTDYDAVLEPGGYTLSASVIDSVTTNPLANLPVTIYTADGEWVVNSCGNFIPTSSIDAEQFFEGNSTIPWLSPFRTLRTDSNGDFVSPDLPSGSYKILFGGDGTTDYAAAFANGSQFIQDADTFVLAGSDVNLGTLEATVGGAITGTVTVNPQHLSYNVYYGYSPFYAVAFANNPHTSEWELAGYTWVDAVALASSGTSAYEISGLKPGSYKVGFFDEGAFPNGVAPEFFDDAVSIEDSATVTVTAGAVTSNIDAAPGLIAPVEVNRFAGAGRYETSVAISQTFAPGVDVVYVASGENFPDALAAAPAAAAQDGPLLIVPRDQLPDVIRDELVRLNPTSIVVVGGEFAVSAGVYDQLEDLAGSGGIRRVFGQDRYQTARAVIEDYWGADSVDRVYIASGLNFPDALSAAAAAGARGVPVITVAGPLPDADPAVVDLIEYLGATEIAIAGGNASVSPGMFTDLAAISGVTDTWRYAGANRYATGGAINRDAFNASDTVYIASGLNFPDALSGAARAGADGAPLYIVPGTCLPQAVVDDIRNFGATNVTILGGTAAVSANIEDVAVCG